jgi:hypothetical protein
VISTLGSESETTKQTWKQSNVRAKKRRCDVTNLVVVLLVPVLWTTLAAADVSGVWSLELDPDFSGHHGSGECIFKQADKKLTGNCGTDSPNPTPLLGEVDEHKVVFQFKTGKNNETTAVFVAKLDDQARTMKGTWAFGDGEGQKGRGKFQATKR